LILDEPCGGLDLVAREQLLQILEDFGRAPESPTMVLVTHHLEEIVPVFTHTLLLKAGRCLASGRKSDILRSDILSDAFGIPLDVREERNRYWTQALFHS
jgi:iron complex transport system ATP-binding protein